MFTLISMAFYHPLSLHADPDTSPPAPSPTSAMPLASLPSEVWFRICTYLSPAELSSLSQVNKELNGIATDETHFRRYLPTPETKCKHPKRIYRRDRALLHPPEVSTLKQMSSCITLLCTFHETLLLVDITRARLIVAPSGLTLNIEHLVGRLGHPFSFGAYYADMARNIVILPENHVAFVTGTKLTRISVLNVISGQITTYFNGGKRDNKFAIAYGKPVAAAGRDAEYLMYYRDRDTVVFFDWRKGNIARAIQNIKTCCLGKMVGYMMSECPSVDGMSVIGVLVEEPTEDISHKIVSGLTFHGTAERFRFRKENKVVVLLKSVDWKTSVFICSSGHPEYKITGFYGRRRQSDSSKTDYAESLSMKTCPQLQDNGRVLAVKHQSLPLSRSRIGNPDGTRVQLMVFLEDSGLVRKATISSSVLPLWSHRTSHGLFVLAAENACGWVQLVNLVEDGNDFEETHMKRWFIQDLNDLCVVGGHLMFATSVRGMLHVFHFDRFCNGARGDYACLLLDQKKPCDTEDDALPGKKRKISHGNVSANEMDTVDTDNA